MLAEARTLLDAPSTPERMQRIEALLKRVALYEGLLPDLPTLEKRIALHTDVLERFRAAGDAAGVRRQAEWIVAAEHLAHAFNDPEMPDDRPQAREQQAHVGYRREIRHDTPPCS